jgi:hypothetical protein
MIHVAYLTRKMPIELRKRLHAMARQKRRQGFDYSVEDIVNAALEIGITMMEQGPKRVKLN